LKRYILSVIIIYTYHHVMIIAHMKDKIEDEVVERVINAKEGWIPREISDLGLTPDLAFEDGDALIIVETAARGDVQSLARLSLYDRLVKKPGREVVLVLASNSFSDQVLAVAGHLGIRTVMLPRRTLPRRKDEDRDKGGMKLTSEKAWRVVSGLLKDQPTSIRNISIRKRVSYGWAHAVCEHLLNQGMARRRGNLLEVTDTDRLMNGAAWERPLLGLRSLEIRTEIADAFTCAIEMERTMTAASVDHTFTGYLAGSLFTGMAVRYDRVQVYVDEAEFDVLKGIYSRTDGKGVFIQLLCPDRDVITDSRIVEGLRLASPEQTLLDLAGLGMGGIELRLAMLRTYASL